MRYSPVPCYLAPLGSSMFLKTPLHTIINFRKYRRKGTSYQSDRNVYTVQGLRFLVLALGVVTDTPALCVSTPRSAAGQSRRFAVPRCLNVQERRNLAQFDVEIINTETRFEPGPSACLHTTRHQSTERNGLSITVGRNWPEFRLQSAPAATSRGGLLPTAE